MKKLVRDRIPQIIEADGSRPVTRILAEEEFTSEILKKLIEESTELKDAHSREEYIEELADVYEVLDAFCKVHHITKDEVIDVQREKRTKRGGFNERIFLEVIE